MDRQRKCQQYRSEQRQMSVCPGNSHAHDAPPLEPAPTLGTARQAGVKARLTGTNQQHQRENHAARALFLVGNGSTYAPVPP